MVYVWEFEFYSSGDYICAVPVPLLEGGTFGDSLTDAVESAADWLGDMVDAHLTDGLELPEMSFGHAPKHGGRVIAVAVERTLANMPAM